MYRKIVHFAPRREAIQRATLVGIIFGIADSGVSATYALAINVSAYYAATLTIKAIIAMLLASRLKIRLPIRHILLISILNLSVIVACIHGIPSGRSFFQLYGFLAQLFLTGTVIRKEDLKGYAAAVTAVTVLTMLYWTYAWRHGDVQSIYGRINFLSDTQPNLGGEIVAAGVFVAGIILSSRSFFVISTASLIPLILLQARAATVFVIFLQATWFYWSLYRPLSVLQKLIVISVLATAAVVAGALLQKALDVTLLINNPYRGLGTGFSGRGALWHDAWIAFLEHPIFGNGFGYFQSIHSPGAHNFFLFILSENGLVGLLIIWWILYGILRFWGSNWGALCWFSSFLILAMFNDRFVNLNPYPFLFFVFMWLPADLIRINCLCPIRNKTTPSLNSLRLQKEYRTTPKRVSEFNAREPSKDVNV